MKRILVVQTTRMGDVLQTTPLIRAIRSRYPDAHIAVLIRDMGQSIAAMDPDIDEVRVYNEDGMFNNMRAKDSERLLKAYDEAREYIQWVRDQKFDVAYNCTNSISSAMLLKLAEVPKVVGADMSDDWHFVLRGRWVNYFFTSVFHRDFNDLNLCDISGRFSEDAEPARQLVMDVPPDVEPTVEQLLARHDVKPDDFIVCFQLGASEASKRWSEVNFARLGRLLVEQYKARIFLLGVKAEAPLGESFEQHAPGLAVPLYGETSIAEVAALLQRARLLVTNDTGTMHIAAAVNCPVKIGRAHV